MFSAFNPSKCTHLEQWAADCAAPGEQSWTFCRSRDSNPQPWVTSGFKSNALSIRPTTAHCPVVNTITSARAPSTRHAYRLQWNLFVDWCSPRREDPRRCPIAVVLSFLQDGLEQRLSLSTLKVYVVAIVAHHDAVDGKYVGKHDLVIRFLRGARRPLASPYL